MTLYRLYKLYRTFGCDRLVALRRALKTRKETT